MQDARLDGAKQKQSFKHNSRPQVKKDKSKYHIMYSYIQKHI